jgi:hypothetical protein
MRIDEAVVHDLSHELGNYFHKLYYWTDCIRSAASDAGSTAQPAQELEETMHRLQEFLNLALEYFQPAGLKPVRMAVADVARALEAQLRGENPDADVASSCPGDVATAALMVDPGRLSTGMRLIARLLGGGSGTRLEARFAGAPRGAAVEVVVSASGGAPDAAARRAQRVVEWAVARRMLELHGGDLVADEGQPGAASCVLSLPLAT